MQQHKNSTNVMESATIQKNEASSKSPTSRRHFFNYFVIAALTVSAVFTSCGSGGSSGGSGRANIIMTTESDRVSLEMAGAGEVTIDWGDGAGIEKVTLTADNNQFERLYSGNSSRTIKITGNVIKLNCRSNHLTSLNVSRATALTTLYCDGNQLTSLDVSKNTALIELHCGDNQLTSLNVS